MTLLKFFLEWGEHGLGALWLAYFIPMGIVGWQVYKGWNQPYGRNNPTTGKWEQLADKTGFKNNLKYFLIAFTVAAIVIHFLIQSSYK